MSSLNKKSISIVLTAVVGISTLFFFNNCGNGFETLQDGVSQSSNEGGGDDTPTTPTVPGIPSTLTAQQYYTQTVLPLYRTNCKLCHVTLPIDAVGPPATDKIYNYAAAKVYALNGTTSTNNVLFNKMSGISHGGNNQCVGDLKGSVTPCKETKTWILMENPLLAEGMAGNTDYVSILGEVKGWALDPADRAAKIQVVVYVDGPVGGGGTLLNTYTADQAGSGVADGHTFKFQLPAALANGAQRRLYVYGRTATAANLIPNSPTTYTAFTGTAAGAATFATLVPKLNACMRCHDWTKRELTLPYLVSPTPLNGGTALSNTFIDNTAGMAHAGGNFCGGGKNAEPCLSIQQWWRDEGLAP